MSNESENASESRESTRGFAIELSAAKSFYLGHILEDNFFPYPCVESDERETLSILLDSLDKFLEQNQESLEQYDREAAQPAEYLESLKELGLFGIVVPEDYQGFGLSSVAYSRIVQQISRYDAATALTIGAHCSIGMKGLLLFGNEDQKRRYLPRLASGEMIAAYCLTEAGAGSDAASIRTTATKNEDGSWTLNGEKIWITNGAFADFFSVFARTGSEKGELSLFIVERAWDGVSTGSKEQKMGIRASATTTVTFEDVCVPAENLVGEEGKGFKIAMAVLNNGRTGLGGGCVGAMKRCIELAAKQAAERKQFGSPIADFGLIQQKIAQMTVNCFAAESVVMMVGHYIDSGSKDYSIEAAVSKVITSEALWDTANHALQVAGGNGYMTEFPYERIVRDSRINLIFEGTNEILRLYIALSGMKEAGQYLKEIAKSTGKLFDEPIKNFGVLSEYASKKFSQLTSLGRDRIESVDERLREEAAVFERYTQMLARATEGLLRRHNKAIIEKQFALKRIADVVIDIFAGCCVLSRATKLLAEKSAEEAPAILAVARVFSQQAKRRMNQNLRRIDINEDEEMKRISQMIVERESYPWDTL